MRESRHGPHSDIETEIMTTITKIALILVCLALATQARPETVYSYEGDNHEHEQEGSPGESVSGTYKWTSPEGEEFFVSYIADEDGYRVVESNAVPVSHDGVAADGQQGSFKSEEEEN